ncbi:MAG: GntR family transcriptional regulator [Chloroflexi bacterium]|nr:GntR family transcriptional regulator [Chloroflexota bacterium]
MADILRAYIRSGVYVVGGPLPSEVELAASFGVSRQTVRQALGQLASEQLLVRVVGRGTFVTIPQRRQTEIISCIVTRLRDEMIAQIVEGAERVAREAGRRLEIINVLVDSALEQQSLEAARSTSDGVLLFPVSDQRSAHSVGNLLRTGFPLVLVDRAIPGVDVDLVTADNVAGGFAVGQLLAKLGHQRILIVDRISSLSTEHEREQGFRQALAGVNSAGMTITTISAKSAIITAYDYLRLPHPECHLDVLQIAEALQEHLPTAVFAINDVTALQVSFAARRLGWRIPDDLTLIGFGDDAHALACDPPLTTVHQDPMEMGRRAMELLISRLQDPSRPAAVVRLPVHLVIRQSAGVPRSSLLVETPPRSS